ncbi:Npun_F0494 family protein [Tumidithrix elongata RA019]|uniref:Npun_F0494 family protein n=1 Tax=Tumidithrix elongata BACA0141 TaxID=2716417 RepID=A0AAW9PQU7_9CYAN|nr:Npun_F0494 family protein [Tumidithrix elongata RA019]
MQQLDQIQDTSATFSPECIRRAEVALRCAPFTLKLLADMAKQGIMLRAIAGTEGIKHQYATHPTNLISTENSLLWLIQVGILRREVDGQGITDSFRLTPLGHYLLDKWKEQAQFPKATIGDRLQNLIAQLQPSRFF